MGLYKQIPPRSSRMGILSVLIQMEGLAILEYGSMGHTLYQYKDAHMNNIPIKARCYSTHLKAYEIALGETQRLHEAIEALIEKPEIEAIALLPSSVGEMIGIDLEGEIAQGGNWSKSVFTVPKGGFEYTYEEGVEAAEQVLRERGLK